MGDDVNQAARDNGVPCIMKDANIDANRKKRFTEDTNIKANIKEALYTLEQTWSSKIDKVRVWERLENTQLEFVDQYAVKLMGTDISKSVFRYRQCYLQPNTDNSEFIPIPIYKSLIRVEELDKKFDNVALSPVDVIDFDGFNALVDKPLDIIDEPCVKEILKSKYPELEQAIHCINLNLQLYYNYDKKSEKWRLVYITDCKPKNNLSEEEIKFLIKLSPDLVDYVVDARTEEIVTTFPRARVRAVC